MYCTTLRDVRRDNVVQLSGKQLRSNENSNSNELLSTHWVPVTRCSTYTPLLNPYDDPVIYILGLPVFRCGTQSPEGLYNLQGAMQWPSSRGRIQVLRLQSQHT